MSKAFTKESDVDEPELGSEERDPLLPPGARNYVTARGLERLRDELARGPETPRRARYLRQRIESAELAEPGPGAADRVRFGCTALVRDEAGRERRYRIVGVDEAEPSKGLVSHVSPLARALLGARAGESVTWVTPQGEEELEVLTILTS